MVGRSSPSAGRAASCSARTLSNASQDGDFKRVLRILIFLIGLLLADAAAATASSGPQRRAQPTVPLTLQVKIGYLGRRYQEPLPLSLVDKPIADNGIQGARSGIDYNRTTGNLLGHGYELVEAIVDEQDDIATKARELLASNVGLIVADLEPADLLVVANLPEAKGAVLLSVRSSTDSLRGKDCRTNLFHILPSWAMRADALAQYFLWKRWRRWFLIAGRSATDREYLAAFERAAKRFGAKIVEQRDYTFEAGYRRTDDGHQQIQAQIPLLTQGAPDHDVVIVVDTIEAFGEYMMWRTFEPRPVAGTHGLVAVAWHRSFEQYAAMQMQNRFERQSGRTMTERDYSAWIAVRTVGEAVTRTGKNSPADVRRYLLSDKFEVAGFKGLGLTFRRWNHQLRQPVLLSGPRSLVSISPQPGFLHERHLTDTLGIDEPESACRLQ